MTFFFSVYSTTRQPVPGQRFTEAYTTPSGLELFEADCFFDALNKIWPDYFGVDVAHHRSHDFEWIANDTRNNEYHRMYMWQGTSLLVKRYTDQEMEQIDYRRSSQVEPPRAVVSAAASYTSDSYTTTLTNGSGWAEHPLTYNAWRDRYIAAIMPVSVPATPGIPLGRPRRR